MTNAVTLKFLLMAEDKASKILQHTGGEVDKAGKKVGGFSTTAKVAMAGAGLAVVGFAASSISKFKQVTTESRGLQRSLGGTLEEASRLREAAILSGVDVETFGKSMQKVDKTLVGATANQKTAAAMTKTLGFAFQDAHGHVKPMGELLPQIADKFAGMADGPEKTALAMKLFGKAGTQMLPFLSKGASGIKELEKESDKFGTTIGNKSIKDLAAAKEGQRKWQASMDGLKVTIGAQLLPMVTQFINFIRDHVIPIVQKITGFIRDHQGVMKLLGIVIGTVVVGLKIWAIVQGVLNAVMAANPIALVVIAIAGLAAGIIYAYKHSAAFRRIVADAFGVVRAAGALPVERAQDRLRRARAGVEVRRLDLSLGRRRDRCRLRVHQRALGPAARAADRRHVDPHPALARCAGRVRGRVALHPRPRVRPDQDRLPRRARRGARSSRARSTRSGRGSATACSGHGITPSATCSG
jgi:hypothetical protein